MSKFLIKFALALKKLRVRVKAAAQHWPSELATLHSPCTSLAVHLEEKIAVRRREARKDCKESI